MVQKLRSDADAVILNPETQIGIAGGGFRQAKNGYLDMSALRCILDRVGNQIQMCCLQCPASPAFP